MDLAAALLLAAIAAPPAAELCAADPALEGWTPEIGGGPVRPGEDAQAAAKRHEEAAYEHVYAERRCEAVVELRRAYAAHPDPGFLFNVATAYALWPGHCPQAVAHFDRYLAACPTCPQSDAATARLAELRPQCPPPPPAPVSAPPPIEVHDAEPAPPPTEPLTTTTTTPKAMPWAPWVLGAASLAALAVGVWAAGEAAADRDRFRDLEDAADPLSDEPLRPTLAGVRDDYDRHRLITWAGTGLGGILAVASMASLSWSW